MSALARLLTVMPAHVLALWVAFAAVVAALLALAFVRGAHPRSRRP